MRGARPMNSGHIDLLCASTVLTKHFQHTKSLYPCHNLERPSPFFRRGNQGLERPRDCPLLRYLSGKSFPFRQIQLQSSAPLCARWPCSPPPPFFHLENWHRHLEYTQPRVRLTRISPPVSTYGDSQAFFKKLW